jgi:hypothetical protein
MTVTIQPTKNQLIDIDFDTTYIMADKLKHYQQPIVKKFILIFSMNLSKDSY